MLYNWQLILDDKKSVIIIAKNAFDALQIYGDCSQIVIIKRISEVREWS